MYDVKAEYKRKGIFAHFGRVFPLCHTKTRGKPPDQWKYKGRVVFQWNNVHTESNQYAVFSEQGTNASHHISGQRFDMIARLPGCHGQDSDTVSVYTHARLQRDDTWVELPPEASFSDESWDQFSRFVVRLTLASYRHHLAGLHWKNHCRTAFLKIGLQAVSGHECLYMQKTRMTFLSV